MHSMQNMRRLVLYLAALATALVTSSPHSPGLTQRFMFAVFLLSFPALAFVTRESPNYPGQ